MPWLKYIFIDHGCEYLKTPVYVEKDFDYRLTGFIPSHKMFEERGMWKGRKIDVGLPRWDNLRRTKHTEKSIFIFFTWRKSMREHCSEVLEYKKRILSFLTSEKLHLLLKENKITLNVGLHHEALYKNEGIDLTQYEYIHLVSGAYFPYISVSDLVITDYSSLAFDFMFLDIPTIFYRFDDDVKYPDKRDRINTRYAKSRDKELYNVFYDEESVLNKIEFYIRNNFILEPEYKKINDSLFWEKENICQHLYEKIEQL